MTAARLEQAAEILRRHRLRAVVCRLPENVVMLTGYWPVLGNSFCLLSLNGRDEPEIRLVVPEDDLDLVPEGAAMEVWTFVEETMEHLGTTLPSAAEPLAEAVQAAALAEGGAVGFEGDMAPVAEAYTQVGFPGARTLELYRRLLPTCPLRDGSEALYEMGAVKMERDLDRIRVAVDVAKHGFIAARARTHPGMTEADAAAAAHAAMLPAGHGNPSVVRLLTQVHVMAGPRAANAHRAYNRTSNYVIQRGDTVLVQLEVAVDGRWAELTRTFLAGGASDFWIKAHEACFDAQEAALQTIRAGAVGREVDHAAREVMRQRKLGEAFKHGLGHGIGFQAINHSAIPKLHPKSEQELRPGMVHNLEPAVYVDGQGGLRLNDNVLVTEDGYELLSAPVPRDLQWMVT